MSTTRGLLVTLAFASVATACTGTDDRGTSVPTGASTPAVSSTTSTSSTTTTIAATTVAPTTSTTTIPPWQRYPVGTVLPLPARTITYFNKVNTTDRVVFLTMDDGFVRDPRVPQLLAEHHAPVTMFLISGSLAADPQYFRSILDLGGSLNSHTLRHAYLPNMDEAAQQAEICGMRDQITRTFGSAGWFFRPPRGEYTADTFTAARACGIRGMILWRVTVTDGVISTWGDAPIQPGDIILVHFLKSTYDSLTALFAELDRLGLTVARLEDYLPAKP